MGKLELIEIVTWEVKKTDTDFYPRKVAEPL